jgi:hypothetical protein
LQTIHTLLTVLHRIAHTPTSTISCQRVNKCFLEEYQTFQALGPFQ